MKLRNKKTGEVKDVNGSRILVHFDDGEVKRIESLAELNEEWEDYEEPKEYWYIEPDGSILQNHKPTYINHLLDGLKSIGNYFETKEEAEKAVEKLKAWKRLKDKGFRFNGWEDSPAEDDFDMIWFTMKAKVWDVETQEALNLLFGGKE